MFTRHERTILGLMSLVHFTLIVDFMIVMPQGPQLMRQFGVSAAQFSLLVSMYTLGAGILTLAAAFFIDRFDRKRALIVSFAAFALGNLACALAVDYEALVAARALTGSVAGVVGALIFAITSDEINVSRRASALGIVLSSFAIASIVGVPLCLLLAGRFGWSAPFHFLALFSLAGCFALGRWLPRAISRPESARATFGRFKELVSDRGRSLALAFTACLILGHFTVNAFLFPSVISNVGISEGSLPVIYLVGGMASMAASILFGRASDRFGDKRVFALALLGSLAPIFFVTNLGPASLLAAVIAVSSYFVLMGGRMTPAMSLISSTSTVNNRGSFLSLIGSVQQLAAALGAFVAGMIVTRAEDGRLLGFGRVGFLAIGFSLAALLLARTIRPLEARDG